jgi:dihydropteroate synthase
MSELARVRIMGIVNVTPDSFSDGGRFFDHARAIEHGLELFGEGADIVDVGGESTRPGAVPVAGDEELRRVLPVVRELARYGPVSIDTRKPDVARAAVEAGAVVINDVSGRLGPVAAELGVGWVVMHAKGDPQTMQHNPTYHDVVTEVRDWLAARLREARELGIDDVWLDPGLGFGKTLEHNLALLANLEAIVALGAPVLVGASRKSMLATLSRREATLPPAEREEQSLAAAIWAFEHGAQVVRVHRVRPVRQFLTLRGAMEEARRQWP